MTVAATYMKEIAWLAGRGYNTLGVSFPATFTGEEDEVTGNFLTVLWENLTDPIITGREELGFALSPGASTVFRHRLVLLPGPFSAEKAEAVWKAFVAESTE